MLSRAGCLGTKAIGSNMSSTATILAPEGEECPIGDTELAWARRMSPRLSSTKRTSTLVAAIANLT
jgi:hypothetical protein